MQTGEPRTPSDREGQRLKGKKILHERDAADAILEAGQVLQVVQTVYCYPLRTSLERILPKSEHARLHQFATDLRSLFTYTLPSDKLRSNLHVLFTHEVQRVLEESGDGEESMPQPRGELRQEALRELRALHNVGLAGVLAQRVLGDVMCNALNSHVKAFCSGQWTSPSNIVPELRDWIENDFARFVAETLAVIQDGNLSPKQKADIVSLKEVERWKEMGINQLGMLRTDELFDIAIDWDETRGAIEDLRSYVTSSAARSQLSSTFSNAIAHRLLQPGASTIEILQVYVAVIRAFTVLDPKGVLLDRVARPIRRYLCERDDTVNIVVGGLLADPDAEDDLEAIAGTALVELAREMNANPGMKSDGDDEHEADLDFDDMNWMPDPVDAGPDYKKSSQNSDVIGSLISLFESRNIFVLEFQKILAERLLQQEYDFEREIRVLELLKMRFGETAMQACEVMLRDILDSRRVDAAIQREIKYEDKGKRPSLAKGGIKDHSPKLHARILSHLFWPPTHVHSAETDSDPDAFHAPPEIASLQSAYARAFTTLKASRKITWVPTLGQVTVQLEFEDRVLEDCVTTWQAAVIYAFQDPVSGSSARKGKATAPVSRSISELSTELSMSSALVTAACTFWVGKLVLRQVSADTYTVLEALPTGLDAVDGGNQVGDASPTFSPNRPRHQSTAAASTSTTAIAAAAALAAESASSSTITTSALPGTGVPGLGSGTGSGAPPLATADKFAPFAPYITGMLTNAGAMPVAQVAMMLRVAVPGGFPYAEGELRGWMEDEVRSGRLGYEGGKFRVAK